MRARYRRILSLSCPISIITNKNGVCSVSFGCDSRVLTFSRWISVSTDWNDDRTHGCRSTPIPVIPFNRIAYNIFCSLHHTHTQGKFFTFSDFYLSQFVYACFGRLRPSFPPRSPDVTIMTTTTTTTTTTKITTTTMINNNFVVQRFK